MPPFDLTDRTAQFPADEGGIGILTDTSGNGAFLEGNLGVPNGIAGHVSDTSDTGLSRGLLRSADRHFQEGVTSPDLPWDIRVTGTPGGLVSATWAGWVWLDNAEQGYFFSIHNPASAAGQAFILIPRETNSGGTASPYFAMADGLVSFNWRSVKATALDTIPLQTWQFVAGGWDADTNTIFSFWGKEPGLHYYNTAAGFAAGFQHTETNRAKVGFWNGEAGQARMYVDHMLWWKGRALTEAELELVWSNNVGLDFNALSGFTGAGRILEDTVTCLVAETKTV